VQPIWRPPVAYTAARRTVSRTSIVATTQPARTTDAFLLGIHGKAIVPFGLRRTHAADGTYPKSAGSNNGLHEMSVDGRIMLPPRPNYRLGDMREERKRRDQRLEGDSAVGHACPDQHSMRFAGLDPAVARCMIAAIGRTVAMSSVRSPSRYLGRRVGWPSAIGDGLCSVVGDGCP
jgi:hypothetical protein